MIPWLFLAVTVWGALFTFNAYLPQRRTGPLDRSPASSRAG